MVLGLLRRQLRLEALLRIQSGASAHAGPNDAGPNDAGPNDAGPNDAGPDDAGPDDAEPNASADDPITHTISAGPNAVLGKLLKLV